MTSIKILGTVFFLGGLLLAFGAVGGMEHQPEANLVYQTAAAVVGLAWMWVGTRLISE